MGFTTDYGVFLGSLVFKGFDHFTQVPMETQLATLQKIMKINKDCELGKKYDFANIHTLRDYQDKVPLSTFDDYAPLVDRMVNNNEENILTSMKVKRYTSSSGSVGKPKLQPKTAKDLWNMQCMGFAATPACAARYFKREGISKKLPTQMGPLVVNLNGHNLENGMKCNGAAQVPFQYLAPILKFFTTTPKDILFPADEENTNTSYFQLRCCLERTDVTYLGTMVITLLVTMFEYMEENWELICNDIEKGTIDPSVKAPSELRAKYEKIWKPNPARAAELRAIFSKGFDAETPVCRAIWPKLCWGYGMLGSTLSVYEEKLRRYVGDLPMHNMGYGASEGFMAMPCELNTNDYVLLPRSLIYEFIPEDAEEGSRPLLMNELEVGKNYEIVVTNFSGLYRYRIMDVVKVTGMYQNTPRVQFLYRSNMGLNTANEKTTTDMLDFVAHEIEKKFGIDFEGYSYYSDTESNPPVYTFLCEIKGDKTVDKDSMVAFIDEKFREINEKYEKYRRWNMLGTPVVHFLKKNTYSDYKASLVAQGRVLNQIKPVVVVNTPERKEFIFAHIDE